MVTESENRVQRIRNMEDIYDRAYCLMQDIRASLIRYRELKPEMEELIQYYSSDEWQDDFLTIESAGFSYDEKRGVLSEDRIYDLIRNISSVQSELMQLFDIERNS